MPSGRAGFEHAPWTRRPHVLCRPQSCDQEPELRAPSLRVASEGAGSDGEQMLAILNPLFNSLRQLFPIPKVGGIRIKFIPELNTHIHTRTPATVCRQNLLAFRQAAPPRPGTRLCLRLTSPITAQQLAVGPVASVPHGARLPRLPRLLPSESRCQLGIPSDSPLILRPGGARCLPLNWLLPQGPHPGDGRPASTCHAQRSPDCASSFFSQLYVVRTPCQWHLQTALPHPYCYCTGLSLHRLQLGHLSPPPPWVPSLCPQPQLAVFPQQPGGFLLELQLDCVGYSVVSNPSAQLTFLSWWEVSGPVLDTTVTPMCLWSTRNVASVSEQLNVLEISFE